MALSPTTIAALHTALDDEYRARATYRSVLHTYGQVAPFTAIAQAEQRHIDALLALYTAHAVPAIADRWQAQRFVFADLADACESGVSGEIGNYRMYDELLTQVAEPDVRDVFLNLRNASAFNHLPAFQHCAAARRLYPVRTPAARPGILADGTLALLGGTLLGAGLTWWLHKRRQTALGRG